MYPTPDHIELPVQPYTVTGYRFRQRLRRRIILWATHLGDDVVCPPGTSIQAIGTGEVVWSGTRPGSEAKRNWGGLVIIGHTDKRSNSTFYSVYGHLTNLSVAVGDTVAAGQMVGVVAPGLTPENGWWTIPHLHFAIYTGPWQGEVLPGYKRPEQRRTKLAWWQDPQSFIQTYNQ